MEGCRSRPRPMESRDKGRPKKVEPIVQAIYDPAVHELGANWLTRAHLREPRSMVRPRTWHSERTVPGGHNLTWG
jgi:hypothetical protein